MIWLLFALLVTAVLLPLAPLLRGRAAASGRGARAASLDAARAERAQLETEIADGRIDPAEILDARLEADRRVLTADRIAESGVRASPVATIAGLAAVAVLGGVTLYAASGRPLLPATHADAEQAKIAEQAQRAGLLIAALETSLAGRDAADPKIRQGFIYLGELHFERAEWPEAVDAWQKALVVQFDPLLAVRTADAEANAAGVLTPEARHLFEQALDMAPPDAPWRGAVEERLTN